MGLFVRIESVGGTATGPVRGVQMTRLRPAEHRTDRRDTPQPASARPTLGRAPVVVMVEPGTDQAGGRKRRRTAPPSSVRRSIPCDTSPTGRSAAGLRQGWPDRPQRAGDEGLRADLVVTDIAIGWTAGAVSRPDGATRSARRGPQADAVETAGPRTRQQALPRAGHAAPADVRGSTDAPVVPNARHSCRRRST